MVFIRDLFLIFSFLGQALSFRKIYAAHLLALAVFAHFTWKQRRKILNFREYYFAMGFLFLAWLTLTLAWNHEITSLKYFGIYLFGLTQYFAFFGLIKEKKMKILKIFAAIAAVEIGIGLLEVLELVRFPLSGLNPSVDFFGKEPTYDFSMLSNFQKEYHSSSPSGFRWGMNNFVFAMMIYLLFSARFLGRNFNLLLLFLGSVLTVFASSRLIFWSCFPLLSIFFFCHRQRILAFASIMMPICVASVMTLGKPVMQMKAIECLTLPKDMWERYFQPVTIAHDMHNSSTQVPIVIKPSRSEVRRLHYFKNNLGQFLEHPIIGSGLGMASRDSKSGETQSPHFFFMEVLTDVGIIGLLFFLVIIVRPIWDCYFVMKDLFPFAFALTALMIVGSMALSSLVYFPLFYLSLGFLHSEIQEEKSKTTQST